MVCADPFRSLQVDFEAGSSEDVRPILRGSADDHEKNLATICEWSPFATKERLLDQVSRRRTALVSTIVDLLVVNHTKRHRTRFSSKRSLDFATASVYIVPAPGL